MSPLAISLISFVFIFSGMLVGFHLGRHLPERHLTPDTKDTVKTAWGMIATMSALVLSLLVASAKNSFDTVSGENTAAAAKVIMLDHVLVRYGTGAEPVRVELRQAVAAEIQSDWQKDKFTLKTSTALEKANGMEQVQNELGDLVPATDNQRGLLKQAKELGDDLFLARVAVIQQTQSSLPNALIVALVLWLTVLFVGISLFAPRNKTVVATLLLCCLSLSFAIFLINDMSHPLHGMIQVSNAPMREALDYLNRR